MSIPPVSVLVRITSTAIADKQLQAADVLGVSRSFNIESKKYADMILPGRH